MSIAAQSTSRSISIRGGGQGRIRILGGYALFLAWLLAGCVDLTEPWKKGSLAAEGGVGGAAGTALDGAPSTGGSGDARSAGGFDSGLAVVDAALGVADVPFSDPDVGDTIFTSMDGPGTAGSTGRVDSSSDSPISASGGESGASGGASGASGAGGSSGQGGAGGGSGGGAGRGSGGVFGSGGSSSSGGALGADASTNKDLGLDAGPDVGPDIPPDLGPDLIPDLATNAADAYPMPPGLVAYYPCEGAKSDGTTLADLSGNGNDATLSTKGGTGTGYGFGTGMVGNALVLTAAGNGYVNLPVKVFAGATDITIAAWVKVATTQDHQRVFDIGINSGRDTPATTGMVYMYLMPYRASAGKMTFGIATNGLNAEQTMTGTTVGPGDGWKHLAIVLGGSGARQYVDGTSTASSTTITLRPKDLGTINYAWIGRSQFGADPTFDGAFDEFRVYNRALSPEEVTTIYQYTQP